MKQIKKVIKDIFLQCYKMDKLGLNKMEMHHPVKHIIINKKGKPVLIDFERCRFTNKPKNVTQFCQFLNLNKDILKKAGVHIDTDRLIELAKDYKKNINETTLNKIIASMNA